MSDDAALLAVEHTATAHTHTNTPEASLPRINQDPALVFNRMSGVEHSDALLVVGPRAREEDLALGHRSLLPHTTTMQLLVLDDALHATQKAMDARLPCARRTSTASPVFSTAW